MVKWTAPTTTASTPVEPDEPEFYVNVTIKTSCKVPASIMDSGDADEDGLVDYSSFTEDDLLTVLLHEAEEAFGPGNNGLLAALEEWGFVELEYPGRDRLPPVFELEINKVEA